MKKSKIVSNSIWSIVQQGLSLFSAIVVSVIVTRYLGTEKSGILGIVNSFIVIISSLSWLGIDSIIVNEIIKNKENEHLIVWTSLIAKLSCSFLLLIFLYVYCIFFYSNDNLFLLSLLIVGAGAAFQCSEAISFWLQSKMMMKWIAIPTIISQVLSLAYQIYIIIGRKNVIWFAAVSLLQNSLLFIILLILFVVNSKSKPIFSVSIFKKLLSVSHHYIISSLAVTLYMHIDKIMIGKMMSNSHAGIYNVAVTVAVCWQFVPLSIINSFRPIILEKKKNNDHDYLICLQSLNFTISVVSIILCIIICFVAKYGINLLYGQEFISSIYPLRITIWATMISMQGVVRGIWFVAEKLYKYDKYFTVYTAVINVMLNIFGIKYFGMVGAAFATVFSYFAEVFIFNMFYKETRIYNSIFLESIIKWKRSCKYLKNLILN